jgi:hypothetical protein
MILAMKGKDKESKKQLKQGSKNIPFFFAFVNFSLNQKFARVFTIPFLYS